MKKILIKKTIFAFIIGVLITSGISIGAISMYSANQVSYKKADDTEIDVKTALDELYLLSDKGVSPTLIWTNPNPTTAMAAQTLTLDLSGYKYFIVVAGETSVYLRTDISDTDDVIQFKTYLGTKYGEMTSGSSHYVVRGVERIPDGVKFYQSYLHNGNNETYQLWNQGLIPKYIYGIK